MNVDEALEQPAGPSEDELVAQWIYSRVRKLGCSRPEARALTESGADYRQAERLIKQGCPLSTAIAIVR